jgi:hypothetical protein
MREEEVGEGFGVPVLHSPGNLLALLCAPSF